jgi:outer membrane protein insertion porin family
MLTGTAEVNFPLVGETLRGVIFADAGTVERDLEITTIRSGVGAGVRFILPIFGNPFPLAVDFAYPVTHARDDDTQIVSFTFGYSR